MDLGIRLVVIGLLKNLIGADPSRLHRGITLMVQRSRVDVHPADVRVPGVDGVDLPHALGHVLRVVPRVLAENQDQPLVSDVQ